MKIHVENSLALVGFHDITCQELEIDGQQSDHCSTSYLFNKFTDKKRCGTIRSIPIYDLFDIESNLETQKSSATWENMS